MAKKTQATGIDEIKSQLDALAARETAARQANDNAALTQVVKERIPVMQQLRELVAPLNG